MQTNFAGSGGSPGSGGSATCVQNAACVANAHWDSAACRCVPDPGDAGTGNTTDAAVCVNNGACIQNTHWDPQQCRCVPYPTDASTSDAADAKFCIDNADCIQGTHWDTQQCRCVPDGCANCTSGQVCVVDQTVGGAVFFPDDAGNCPNGRVIVPAAPGKCSPPPTYHCANLPATCNTAPGSTAIAHCVCAKELCTGGTMCSDLTPTLMQCLLLAP
jgi:hypothetical protein